MVRPEALDWLEEAKMDLKHAGDSLKLRSFSWSCFAAQQACEKALKAVSLGVAKRRPTHLHDLTMLYHEVRSRLKLPREIADNLGELSAYYALARYPNAGLTRPSIGISRLQAERAIATARKVLERVEEILTSAKGC